MGSCSSLTANNTNVGTHANAAIKPGQQAKFSEWSFAIANGHAVEDLFYDPYARVCYHSSELKEVSRIDPSLCFFLHAEPLVTISESSMQILRQKSFRSLRSTASTTKDGSELNSAQRQSMSSAHLGDVTYLRLACTRDKALLELSAALRLLQAQDSTVFYILRSQYPPHAGTLDTFPDMAQRIIQRARTLTVSQQ